MIDTENPSSQVEDRLVSMLSGIEEKEIKNGQFAKDKAKAEKVFEAVKLLKGAEIYHHYIPNFTFDAANSLIKRYKIQKGIELVSFDYIKVTEGSMDRNVMEHQSIGYLADNLHNKVAGALNIPVITAAQVGRSAIGANEERDDHVADSDRIGRYVDALIFFREKTDEEKAQFGYSRTTGNMVATVQTNRGGSAREYYYDIWFDRPVMKMTEVRARAR
jgi:hypothetical protein